MSHRKLTYLAFIFGTLAGLGAGILAPSVVETLILIPEPSPKSANSQEREAIRSLMSQGYASASACAAGVGPVDERHFDRVITALESAHGASKWFERRLLEELGRSHRPKDGAYLWRRSESDGRLWFRALARKQARRVLDNLDD